jgi:hypothetical protein
VLTFVVAALGAVARLLLLSSYTAGPRPESLSSSTLSSWWARVLAWPGCKGKGPSRGCVWGLRAPLWLKAEAGTVCNTVQYSSIYAVEPIVGLLIE